MKYKAYPKYRPSGVEWLEKVPEHWEVRKGRHIGILLGSVSPKEEDYIENEEGIRFAKVDDLNYLDSSLSLTNTNSRITGFPVKTRRLIVFPKRGAAIFTNKVAIAEGEFLFDSNLMGFQINSLNDTKYVAFCLMARRLDDLADVSTVPQINKHIYPALFPCPPLKEQSTISDYLERETVKIDNLLTKKRALIEKLKEKRTALISRTVTRGLPPEAARAAGLDPHPKLKPSGVEWLGDVPEHWTIKSIKHVTRIIRGKFSHRPRNDPRLYEGQYPFIQTGDVSGAKKYIENYQQTLNEEGFAVSKLFPQGTLVMTIAANIGDIAILNFEACFPDSIVGFVPETNVGLEYLYFLFQAMHPVLFGAATLNTQLNLNIERIGSIKASIPSFTEQTAIATYLDYETNKIDSLIEKVQTAIEKLKEYRTALITAAVTGKIDVRPKADGCSRTNTDSHGRTGDDTDGHGQVEVTGGGHG